MLKVAVFGATGRVGRVLVTQLKEDSTNFKTPLVLVRTSQQKKYFEQSVGVDAGLIDLENSSVDDIAHAIADCNAIVFTAGSGNKFFTVDLDGCVKVMEAAEKTGIRRFILVSALKAEDRTFWESIPGLREYYIAKRAADRDLRTRDLDYTIVQPGWLYDEKGTGLFTPVDKIDEQMEVDKSCQREDVASFIKECLTQPKNTIRKTIPLLNGTEAASTVISLL
ncbi:hypothetical protein KAFR_0A00730 [Kazachstania africana CBS 2517]|uniref:NAD(P)-binding domain-containing protein n=1 Tax=Kazachstania africana (strain ATCC 22294 / BCRC 22015 / CBS 2517 / CECT 1963 / NBRC 1671 / NRRL Y-8276) TaxID=1071382 RepID=H2AMB1_KAZAF|nr:hypothetical protein KAFR_0A00730 [Kazachstania africana CBS 2517]CCF55511.1 hypothetical protein KAFR_0A00730 [Kazachstania africana CBS 2517]